MSESVAILIDTTRCTGCEQCVAACKRENGLGRDRPRRGQGPVSGLSSTRYCTILPQAGGRFVRQQCRHCLDPACVSACLVGAMQKTAEGPVIYDADKCMGCRYCMIACPYGIPRYEWDQAVPYVRKCSLCQAGLRRGKAPPCVEQCPEEAAIFGGRAQLLEEAKRRLRDEPDKYLQHIDGEHEFGGTSILYISDVPLGFLTRLPHADPRPLPDRTWASLSKVPPLMLGVGGLMAGVHWIIGRRMKLSTQAVPDTGADSTGGDGPATTDRESENGDA